MRETERKGRAQHIEGRIDVGPCQAVDGRHLGCFPRAMKDHSLNSECFICIPEFDKEKEQWKEGGNEGKKIGRRWKEA